MKKVKQVVLVGHCGFDARQLRHTVSQALEGIDIDVGNHQGAIESFLGPDCLLLINRVLDGRFDHRYGVELIEALALRETPPTLMLISNEEDAQLQAVAAGGLRGFGKSQAGSDQVTEQLRDAARW